LIKPWPLARNANLGDDQFSRDDFSTCAVTYPNNITTHLSLSGAAIFGAKCRGCPVR